jgi:replicative DNA helicase
VSRAANLLELPEQKSMPHSEESERACLGAVLLDPSLLEAELAPNLRVEDLYADRNRLVYAAMLALMSAGVTVDLVTLQAKLDEAGTLAKAGGLVYLTSLDLELPDIGRLSTYIDIVRERACRRRLIQVAGEAMRDALGGAAAAETIGNLKEKLDGLMAAAVPVGLRPISEPMQALLVSVEEAASGKEALQGFSTGFPGFDALTFGLMRGGLYILGGMTGMGKTSLAMDIARRMAVDGGKTVAVFSLEQPTRELAIKLLCAQADIPTGQLRRGYLSGRQWTGLVVALRVFADAQLWVDDASGLTLRQIEAKLRRLLSERPVHVAFLDYLQLISPERRSSNREADVAAIAKEVKDLAKDLDIAIVALSQINPPRRDDKRPILTDLRESQAISHAADLVSFVHRPEYFDPTNPALCGITEWIIAKYRHGQIGKVDLRFANASFQPLEQVGGDPF